jgi:hypothetical protein
LLVIINTNDESVVYSITTTFFLESL